MKESKSFLFSKANYILMAIGVILVIVGFVLMVAQNDDPNSFNPAIYDFRHITLAPMLIIAGFIMEFIAIFKK